MRLTLPLLIGGAMIAPANAADIKLSVEIPRLNVAEYHRPYVAVWLESAGSDKITNLAVWYDLKLKQKEGTKWLKDMRQWWRKAGRELDMPVDGLSSATRPPGTHPVTFAGGQASLEGLAPGEYQLVVEAAREVGGRELLRLPFQWPPAGPEKVEAKGEHELGLVALTIAP